MMAIAGPWLVAGLVLGAGEARAPAAEKGPEVARIRVRTAARGPRVHPFVYGHFLEHIYHSVVDGLDGQAIRNRSFEETAGGVGAWSREGEAVVQGSLGTDIHIAFGDPAWTDYEYTLEACKDGGAEGFLILFRASDADDFYWWNLGGWGDTKHALECEVRGGRRIVTPFTPGRIEKGRWYRIRVRVEGDRIEGFLDGEKLLDTRSDAHPRGGVGLGTWATRARFRHIRVTALDGKVLFDGVPKVAERPAIALAWEAWGEGARYALDGENPFNSKKCQRIVLAGGKAGIAQGRLFLRKGETYRGSVYLEAGGFEGEGFLRFEDDDGGTIWQRPLRKGEIAPDWKGIPFEFTSSGSTKDGRVVIGFEGRGTIRVDQVTMRSDRTTRCGGFRPDLLEAVRALRPPIIRWPGGCFAEFYRWKTGIGPQERRVSFPNLIWGEMDDAGFGTDEFVRLCRTVGAEPLVVLNLGTHEDPSRARAYLREALEWIEYLNGAPDTPMGRLRARYVRAEPYGVRYVELDNETWFMGVERYAARVKLFAPAIRKRWPDLAIFACGSAGHGRGGLEWNERMLDLAAEHFDYLSIHHYENPDRFARGPRDYEAFWRRTREAIRRSRNPKIKIAITEWNAQSTDWRTGLYAGGLLVAMERQADVVGMASPALFIRRVDAPAWDNAFINHDHTGWFPAPNYVVMKLFRDHFAPQVVASEAPEALSVVAGLDGEGRLVVKIVNPTAVARPARIEIGGTTRGMPRAWTVAAGLRDRNTFQEPRRIAPRPLPARAEGGMIAVDLPAYSVTVLEIALTG